jgi:low affinity Fe/Cu permease
MKNQTVAKERRPIAFGLALVVLLIWGPFFDYSQGWQLVVNTALKAASGDRPESAASRGGDLI